MVCTRCIMAVQTILEQSEIKFNEIHLGEVETHKELSEIQLKNLATKLNAMGFEILEDQSQKLIENIKILIVSKVSTLDISEDFLLSEFLSTELYREYSAISKLFSRHQGMTLEHYFILQKIEKVKELLFYQEYSLKEIAAMLGYKSVQHLSSQFRNITGFTPTLFKNMKVKNRKPLDTF